MTVFLLHGIVDQGRPGAAAWRDYVPRHAFEEYLRWRRVPFGEWSADSPGADVLTVDDSTRAGADACLTARRLGHEVIFFVNPFQIASGQPYFFKILDAAIDARSTAAVTYRGTVHDVSGPAAARRFRFAVREALMVKPASEAYEDAMEVAAMLGAPDVQVGAPDVTLSRAEILALRDAGVRIENHGWSHREIAALDDEQFAAHVTDGRDWLREEISVDATLYAVPFGDTPVPDRLRHWVADGVFLASDRFPPGRVDPRCWNRRDLAVEMRGVERLMAYVAIRGSGRGSDGGNPAR